jgi:3',5'-cyclic AMP phosphodiesterase CpdA
MRLAWATDIHFDAAEERMQRRFLEALAAAAPDAVLLGGDIGTAESVGEYLEAIAAHVRRPTYFVLGNHDFYQGRIAGVRDAMRALSASSPLLRWLNVAGIVRLTERTALVGHDGWADGRLGQGERSPVILNDSLVIGDFADILKARATRGWRWADDVLDDYAATRDERLALKNRLADEAAAHARDVLPAALDRFEHVVFLTHAPPFAEAAWYDGAISNDEWLPHMVCSSLGDAVRDAAAARPDHRVTVLCGHTHGRGVADILPNLRVRTGGAQYGNPVVQDAWDVE